MLSEFFESRVRIRALRDGPAGSLLESFAQALSQAGYVRRIARRYLRAAEHFIFWTHRHGMPLGKLNEQSFARFERHLSRCRCPHYGHADHWGVGRGARMFLTYLQDTSIVTLPPSAKPTIHDPALLSAFCQWMRQQRGTCDVTLYTPIVFTFASCSGALESSQTASMLASCERLFSRRVGPAGGQQLKIAPRYFGCSCVS